MWLGWGEKVTKNACQEAGFLGSDPAKIFLLLIQSTVQVLNPNYSLFVRVDEVCLPEIMMAIVRKDLGGPGLPCPWPRLPRHAWSRYGYVDDSCRVCSASCSVLGSSKLGKTGA